MRLRRFLTRNIVLLSLVSLFTDLASEMVYPVIPLYLTSIGLSVVAIGMLEGVAQAITGLSQGWFGYWSDKSGRPAWFVRAGYGLSAVSKPLLGIFAGAYAGLFAARTMDRFGKAVRSAARDSILAQESATADRGKVFGFHRSLDTLGATLGPLAALAFLFVLPGRYQLLFLIAFIPGAAAVLLTFLVRTGRIVPKKARRRPPRLVEMRSFWRSADPGYRRLLGGYLLLALVNSSDFYLLLRARELGLSELTVIAVYILFNLVGAAISLPLGAAGDKWGFRRVYLAGLIVFATVYGSLAYSLNLTMIIVVFALYGIFAAVNESVTKAWLSTKLHTGTQGTGIGLYLTLNALASLAATLGTGLVWQAFGSAAALSLIASLSLAALLYFLLVPIDSHLQENPGDEAVSQGSAS
jgi:MFS family permease